MEDDSWEFNFLGKSKNKNDEKNEDRSETSNFLSVKDVNVYPKICIERDKKLSFDLRASSNLDEWENELENEPEDTVDRNRLTLPIPTLSWGRHSIVEELTHERNHISCTTECTNALIEAVKKGNTEEVEMLLESGEDVNGKDCCGKSPLHYISSIIINCSCDSCLASATKCAEMLLESPDCEINIQDNNGETPLHLAAETQFPKLVSLLLYHGANVYIKSKTGVKALTLILEKSPQAMECLFNRAVTVSKYNITNAKCEIKLDFGAIVGLSEYRGKSRFNGNKSPPPVHLNDSIKGRTLEGRKEERETQLLKLMLEASSATRKKILTHPLIAIFLYMKWKRVRTVFWATILCHMLLLLCYTLYILDVYIISCPYRPKITEPEDIEAAREEGLMRGNDTHLIVDEYIHFSWFGFKPESKEDDEEENITPAGECHLELGPTLKSILVLSLCLFMCINEVFKMLPSPRSYLRRRNNKLNWTLFFFIFLTSWPAFMAYQNISFWQYQAAAFGLFLCWALMLTHMGKFPTLGIYIDIFSHVLKNFGFFMITYASLLIAFALAFCVLFPGNAPYSSIPLAILKVLMMMVGEVNYEELFYGKEETPVDDLLYPITGHILYGAFVIMITIVLMNLLVGLTVSDIQGLRKDAQTTKIVRQIAEISQIESFVFSRRVQSFCPGSLGSFIRNSIRVVRKGRSNEDAPQDPFSDQWHFTFRPNDPNDKSLPEELKVAVLRLAAEGQKRKKSSRCLLFSRDTATTPASFEDRTFMNSNDGLNGPPRPPRRGISTTTTTTTKDKNTQELEYFFKKLEDKIMNRMKIQMTSLYQKIEEKMLEK